MISRASLALVLLLAGAASLPSSFATAANSSDLATAQQAKAAQVKAAQAKKARLAKQQQLKKEQLLAKQQQEPKKDEWYAKDRDRGLDVAATYAPDTIAKLRKNNTIAKGDTVSTGDGKKGWRHYLDKYYAR
ncbi:hypothetical protein [Hyphomicrobium sp.]|uniref:hypothetical protein n=1 Tax=Hyphomicrobium sp. TaxID=82 RepID=UPI002E30FCDF|nr:hypothetical protein [Hyphomicrobium sp.]HEX2840109.1 hypothetical protein [Hyphomicrobium sp.]